MNVMNEFFKKLAEEAFFDEASSIPSDIMYKFSDHKMQKFAELIVKECIEQIHLECEDFANGNCFADHALWESVTREYGENKERGFDPVGMSIHFDKMLKKHFGVENA